MKIALYCPLNDPDDGGTSGDRRMARQIRSALSGLGHDVETIVAPCTHRHEPEADFTALERRCHDAADLLLARWRSQGGAPDLWLTYHNYHKTPDLIGPRIATALGIPLVLIEASHTPSKRAGPWALRTAAATQASQRADMHLCFTRQDRAGLMHIVDEERLTDLPPFIDTQVFQSLTRAAPRLPGQPLRLVSMAMMRMGGKLASYLALAEALAQLPPEGWYLTLAGDGPARADVEAAFAIFGAGRVHFAGQVSYEAVPALLAAHDVFCWPGLREPFGLVFLEAQAAGLPVVAFASGGVAETVRDGTTALLVPEGDSAAFAARLCVLKDDAVRLANMGHAAREFVMHERDISFASNILSFVLVRAVHHFSIRKEPLP